MAYRVFSRNWWKHNSKWPDGLEPNPAAKKTTICEVATYAAAVDVCRVWNLNHERGRLCRMAEFTAV